MIAVLCAAALVAGALAWADRSGASQIASGVTVAGIPVGGLSDRQAAARVRARIAAPARRPVTVHVAGRRFVLSADRSRVRLDVAGAVRRARAAGRRGAWPARGWRQLRGAKVIHDEPVPVTFDRGAVERFVTYVHRAVARRAVDAELHLDVDRVWVSPARAVRRLTGRQALAGRVAGALRLPHGRRSFRARTAVIAPGRRADDVWAAQPTAVTVSQGGRRVRVFRRGELVDSYQVAVGEKRYPTPMGQFAVQTMQKNPPWIVPNSDWAGELAGRTIPGGDPQNPLVARWIGFDGAIGFHGTPDKASLGQAASHGCVRMDKDDVIDLYKHVQSGTPVLVGR